MPDTPEALDTFEADAQKRLRALIAAGDHEGALTLLTQLWQGFSEDRAYLEAYLVCTPGADDAADALDSAASIPSFATPIWGTRYLVRRSGPRGRPPAAKEWHAWST